MLTISLRELQNDFGKYVDLAETEEIQVTKGDAVVFTMVPRRQELAQKLQLYFGCLPADATIGKNPDERW